jgi:hypothetical protein
VLNIIHHGNTIDVIRKRKYVASIIVTAGNPYVLLVEGHRYKTPSVPLTTKICKQLHFHPKEINRLAREALGGNKLAREILNLLEEESK